MTTNPQQTNRWRVFGQWLKKQREEKELTQDQAAKSANVSRRQWMRYESGKKVLQKQIPGIAHALDLPTNTVLQRALYKPIPGVSSGLTKMYQYLKTGDPVSALQELLKVDAKINDRPYNDEQAKNFAELVLQLDSLPPEQATLLLEQASKKRTDKTN